MKKRTLVSALGFIIFLMVTAVAWATPVPETGQTKCYNADVEIACPSPGQPFYGQDANYSINPMSFTKLGTSGDVLPDSATSWVMVRDNVTELIWENKTVDGTIHDKNRTHIWHDPTNPNPGTPGAGTDTKDFLDALNSARFGGYSDWRLPTIKELTSIVNYGIPSPGPMINTGYFPNTVSSFYWSSTTYSAYNTNNAWGVNFYDGYDYMNNKTDSGHVRAVRGGQSASFDPLAIGSFDAVDNGSIDDATASADSYTDNGDGTVTDTSTGLTWQQTSASNHMKWEQALAYCEGLNLGGYTDWRLPTKKELESLVDYSRYNPAINMTYFPSAVSTQMSGNWSSTTLAGSAISAWGVNFYFGYNYLTNKLYSCYVRAVRGGQTGLLGNLVISPTNQSVTKEAGTTTFSVSNTGTGTMPWTAAVTSGGSWLTIISGSSGTDTGTIICSFTANISTSVRTATIRVTATDAVGSPKDVTVTQAPTPVPVLSVTPANQSITKDAGNITFSVSNTGIGTMNWTAAVTPASSWLVIKSGTSGTDTGTITCSYSANTGTSSRTATIRITATGATGSPKSVTVTQAPTPDVTKPIISPVADTTILWPSNHKMVNVTIKANASDNSGLPVTLIANVSSNEPVISKEDGDLSPDWTQPVIKQATGVITLQLRAERLGNGNGRVYSISITATDQSGNSSVAVVKVLVPHDIGK